MADVKKYYYMRLKEDFFDSDEIKILESMEDGYLYSNILLKMYLKSLKNEGRLMLNNIIPYNEKMIASITGHQIGTVERALKIFKEMGFIEVVDNGAIYMMEIQNFIGESTTQADRQRAYDRRIASEKKSVRNLTEIEKKSYPEIKIEKEKEIELKKKDADQVLSESNLDDRVKDCVREFIKMRKMIKAPMTDRALILMLNKLKEMSEYPDTQIEILNQSIENSWKGLYPLKQETWTAKKPNWDTNRQNSDPYDMIAKMAERM